MIVCLKTRTWRGVAMNAVHFYGKLEEYEDGEAPSHDVTRTVDRKTALMLNKEDEYTSYKPGDTTTRFWDEQEMLERAKEQARETWGEDVQLYRGARYYALEDMERLL